MLPGCSRSGWWAGRLKVRAGKPSPSWQGGLRTAPPQAKAGPAAPSQHPHIGRTRSLRRPRAGYPGGGTLRLHCGVDTLLLASWRTPCLPAAGRGAPSGHGPAAASSRGPRTPAGAAAPRACPGSQRDPCKNADGVWEGLCSTCCSSRCRLQRENPHEPRLPPQRAAARPPSSAPQGPPGRRAPGPCWDAGACHRGSETLGLTTRVRARLCVPEHQTPGFTHPVAGHNLVTAVDLGAAKSRDVCS